MSHVADFIFIFWIDLLCRELKIWDFLCRATHVHVHVADFAIFFIFLFLGKICYVGSSEYGTGFVTSDKVFLYLPHIKEVAMGTSSRNVIYA